MKFEIGRSLLEDSMITTRPQANPKALLASGVRRYSFDFINIKLWFLRHFLLFWVIYKQSQSLFWILGPSWSLRWLDLPKRDPLVTIPSPKVLKMQRERRLCYIGAGFGRLSIMHYTMYASDAREYDCGKIFRTTHCNATWAQDAGSQDSGSQGTFPQAGRDATRSCPR